jgi:hypothetical protein
VHVLGIFFVLFSLVTFFFFFFFFGFSVVGFLKRFCWVVCLILGVLSPFFYMMV